MSYQNDAQEASGKLGLILKILKTDIGLKACFGRTGALRLNLMLEEVELDGVSIGVEDFNLVRPRIALARLMTTSEGKPVREPSLEFTRSAIECLASEDAYHPVEEWLTGLVWDKADRWGDLAAAFGHVPGSIEAVFLRKTILAMVARATKPGCKVDTVLVLTGAQGKLKSTAFAALAAPWFTDEPLDFGSKDSKVTCHRKWLIELSELSSLRKSKDVEEVKAFVSKVDDDIRAAFARKNKLRLRRFVMVGTTNQEEFLTDSTGNRRFWPISIGEAKIDVSWLKENREQLFAQACHEIAKEDAIWWLTDEEEKLQAVKAAEHVITEPWIQPIKEWLAKDYENAKEGVSIQSIMDDALHIDTERQNSGVMRRIGVALGQLGWAARKVHGNRKWFPLPP